MGPHPERETVLLSVDALMRACNPWHTLGISQNETWERVLQAQPQRDFVPEESRTKDYHFGRIREFVTILLGGGTLDPIRLATLPTIPHPVLVDGNHRLIAHFLVGNGTISVVRLSAIRGE